MTHHFIPWLMPFDPMNLKSDTYVEVDECHDFCLVQHRMFGLDTIPTMPESIMQEDHGTCIMTHFADNVYYDAFRSNEKVEGTDDMYLVIEQYNERPYTLTKMRSVRMF